MGEHVFLPDGGQACEQCGVSSDEAYSREQSPDRLADIQAFVSDFTQHDRCCDCDLCFVYLALTKAEKKLEDTQVVVVVLDEEKQALTSRLERAMGLLESFSGECFAVVLGDVICPDVERKRCDACRAKAFLAEGEGKPDE